jgi:hypothetical protein
MRDAVTERKGEARAGHARPWLPSPSAVAVTSVILVTAFLVPVGVDDLWWHLAAGELVLRDGHAPDRNLFSFTAPDHPWIAHEWLAEAALSAVHDQLGWRWLVLLAVALGAATCAVVARLARRLAPGAPYLAAAIALATAFLLLANFSIRPWLAGNLLLACWLALCESPAAGGRARPLLVAALFAIWANVHGSVALGVALAALYAAEALVTRAGSAALWPRGRDLVVAAAASLLTPFGARGLLLPLAYAGLVLGEDRGFVGAISEWQPVEPWSPLGLTLLAYAGCCAAAVICSSRPPRPAQVALAAAGAALAFAAVRNAPLLGLGAVPLLSRHLPDAASRLWRAAGRRSALAAALSRARARSLAAEARSRADLLPAAVLAALAVATAAAAPWPYAFGAAPRDLADLSPRSYPRALLAALRARDGGLRVFNHLDWGGAIVWSLGPDHRVFIDQRNDCYPPEVWRDYLTVHRLEPGWREVLDRRGVEAVAYPADSALVAALRREPGWTLAHEDPRAALFVRARPEPTGAAADRDEVLDLAPATVTVRPFRGRGGSRATSSPRRPRAAAPARARRRRTRPRPGGATCRSCPRRSARRGRWCQGSSGAPRRA